ncbi:GntR family transcriptional regulator, partial [Nocardioides plantarum]
MTIQPLDPDAATPLYEQLRAQIAGRAATGDLPAGTRLPTV